MEGIMTGIKPRESFNEKGMSDAMRDDLKSIQSRVNLIDAFSGAGASPLADPLTQFLLQIAEPIPPDAPVIKTFFSWVIL